jgi:hypothetical protein
MYAGENFKLRRHFKSCPKEIKRIMNEKKNSTLKRAQERKEGKESRQGIAIGSKPGEALPKEEINSKRKIVQIIKPLSGALLK